MSFLKFFLFGENGINCMKRAQFSTILFLISFFLNSGRGFDIQNSKYLKFWKFFWFLGVWNLCCILWEEKNSAPFFIFGNCLFSKFRARISCFKLKQFEFLEIFLVFEKVKFLLHCMRRKFRIFFLEIGFFLHFRHGFHTQN